jgi:hypothetical protein
MGNIHLLFKHKEMPAGLLHAVPIVSDGLGKPSSKRNSIKECRVLKSICRKKERTLNASWKIVNRCCPVFQIFCLIWIAHIIEQEGLDTAETLMVGDRVFDIEGGKKNKLVTAAVA